MNANQIAQVANHLNVSPNQIKRCEEWATVLFVVFRGCRPRFVSKGVVKVAESFEDLADKAEAMAAKIADRLPIGNCASYEKLFNAACRVLDGDITFEQAVERFTSKKIIKK